MALKPLQAWTREQFVDASSRCFEKPDARARGVDSADAFNQWARRRRPARPGLCRQPKSQRTIKAYATDWRDFLSGCSTRGLGPRPAPAETVALYSEIKTPEPQTVTA